ncbi:LytR C-terminal domain-containing protein, partial [Streptomyces griseorubens]|uniref:LytR C-terminal domain-containing protein n=1 Tax=Streptomyces griseorubens TaxID=66897 RepID=UPI003517B55C
TDNEPNATTRSGLAQKTAAELKTRGIKVGEVAPAPETFDKKVKGTGVLLGPATALDTALPVRGTQLAGAERRTDPARKGVELERIIGDAFRGLSATADADKALTALANPEPAPASMKNC